MDWEAELEAAQTRRARFPEEIRDAHTHATRHRSELLASEWCGCFYCGAIYSPVEITEWIDDDQTALCAKCGIDSVIGTKSGFPITSDFLAEMYRYWFASTKS